jgi:spermidine synthase
MDPEKDSPHPKGLLPYLVVTTTICGALIMVLEVLGSRVIGPFFGVSLFIWTSLITVTLIALALGYAVGGVVSDRYRSPDYLYAIILAAGVLVLLIPLIKGPVLKLCLSLGLRSGAFLGSVLLFGPSLFFLGCVSPYIVKIAVKETAHLGRTVGVFYALSTVGSFLGTVLTGFVLIAYFRVNTIFAVIGILLVALSAVYFFLFRKRWYFLLLLVVIPFLADHQGTPVSKVMQNGTTVTEVYSRDTFYGTVKVVDYTYAGHRQREMIIDGLVQGGIDMENHLSVYEYAYFMERLPYSLNPSGKKCLAIGLGAGVVPMWYEKMGIKTDVVDINPHVVEVAREYFDFTISGEVVVGDARAFLTTGQGRYDYVILDVFTGDTTPSHILSIEALRELKARMTEQGILAINLIGSLKGETFMTVSIIRTLERVFKTVIVYPIFSPEEGEGMGNIEVLAYDYPFPQLDLEGVRNLPTHPLVQDNVRMYLGKTVAFPSTAPFVVLSDDYNPVDFYDLPLKERVRERIIEDTEWDILI